MLGSYVCGDSCVMACVASSDVEVCWFPGDVGSLSNPGKVCELTSKSIYSRCLTGVATLLSLNCIRGLISL